MTPVAAEERKIDHLLFDLQAILVEEPQEGELESTGTDLRRWCGLSQGAETAEGSIHS